MGVHLIPLLPDIYLYILHIPMCDLPIRVHIIHLYICIACDTYNIHGYLLHVFLTLFCICIVFGTDDISSPVSLYLSLSLSTVSLVLLLHVLFLCVHLISLFP